MTREAFAKLVATAIHVSIGPSEHRNDMSAIMAHDAVLRAEIERLQHELDGAMGLYTEVEAKRQDVERLRQERDDAIARSSSYLVDLNACRKDVERLTQQLAASQARVRELETGWMEWNGRRIPLPEYAASIRQRDRLRAALDAIAQYHSDCSLCQDMIDQARQALGKAGG